MVSYILLKCLLIGYFLVTRISCFAYLVYWFMMNVLIRLSPKRGAYKFSVFQP